MADSKASSCRQTTRSALNLKESADNTRSHYLHGLLHLKTGLLGAPDSAAGTRGRGGKETLAPLLLSLKGLDIPYATTEETRPPELAAER